METQFACVKTYEVGGRGRKICPNCKQYVGCKNQYCACSYEFVKGEPKIAQEDDPVSKSIQMFAFRMGFSNGRICTTPAGKFTTTLDSLCQNDVIKFCDDVIEEYGEKRHVLLSPEAIKYLGRYHLKLESDDLVLFNMYVDEWFNQISAEFLEYKE